VPLLATGAKADAKQAPTKGRVLDHDIEVIGLRRGWEPLTDLNVKDSAVRLRS
jgi:hypothetical protein